MSFRSTPTGETRAADTMRQILDRLSLLERNQNRILITTGLIARYGGSSAPAGWVVCDGTLYDGTQPKYALLWAVIGTTYGGAGIASFKVPTISTSPITVIKL